MLRLQVPFRVVAILAVFGTLPALTQANSTDIPRTDSKIEIDGVIDEAAWQEAVQVDIDIETRPGENIRAPVTASAYLLEDGKNLYLAFDARDPDPASIRAYLRDRDSAWDDDFIGVVLDTYNDERRAFQFFANPLGVQMDMTNDDVNKNEDDSWDAIWTSAGTIYEGGYIVEMQIPLSQLRFPSSSGVQTWGFDLVRIYPREHRYRLSNNPLDRNLACYLCQVSKLSGLEGSSAGRDIEIVPTITASKIDSTDDPGFEPFRAGNTRVEGGIGLRWGITPDVTANMALNPDFSQVESDVAQLAANERFALFFPEKRPFFLEGADYFRTPVDAVFTRTVSDPDVGAKLTGKRGNNTFGMFAARDAATDLLFPGLFGSDSTTVDAENTAVVGRYSRGFGDASSIGGLVTLRDGDGYYNHVGGIDGRWKINDQHSIRYQYLRSDTRYPRDIAIEFDQPMTAFSGGATSLGYDYNSRNWFAYAGFEEFASGFRADSGFIPRAGSRDKEVEVGRVWHGGEQDWWSRIRARISYELSHDESDRLLERETEARLGIGGPLQSWYQVGMRDGAELYEGVLYRLQSYSLYAELQPRGGLSLGGFARIGDAIDYDNDRKGHRRFFEPQLSWNVSRNLLLRFRGVFVDLETEDGEEIFDASVADVRLTWQFSLRSFLRLTVQHQDTQRNIAVYDGSVDARYRDEGRQLLYSYKVNPQTVFFLGYSDRYLDDDDFDGLMVADRAWFLKVGYAWTL